MRLSGTLHVRGFGIRQACWLERRGHPWNVLAVAVYGSTRSGCRRSAIPLTSPFTNTASAVLHRWQVSARPANPRVSHHRPRRSRLTAAATCAAYCPSDTRPPAELETP
jgi:hypothetical protein